MCLLYVNKGLLKCKNSRFCSYDVKIRSFLYDFFFSRKCKRACYRTRLYRLWRIVRWYEQFLALYSIFIYKITRNSIDINLSRVLRNGDDIVIWRLSTRGRSTNIPNTFDDERASVIVFKSVYKCNHYGTRLMVLPYFDQKPFTTLSLPPVLNAKGLLGNRMGRTDMNNDNIFVISCFTLNCLTGYTYCRAANTTSH